MVSYPPTITFLLIAFSLISVFVLLVMWQNGWLDHVRSPLLLPSQTPQRLSPADVSAQLLPRALRWAGERPGEDIQISPTMEDDAGANSPASSSGWLDGSAAVENDGAVGAASQGADEGLSNESAAAVVPPPASGEETL